MFFFPSALEVLGHSRALKKFWTNELPGRTTFWISITLLFSLLEFLGLFIWVFCFFICFTVLKQFWIFGGIFGCQFCLFGFCCLAGCFCFCLSCVFFVFWSCESAFLIFNALGLLRQVSSVIGLLCSSFQFSSNYKAQIIDWLRYIYMTTVRWVKSNFSCKYWASTTPQASIWAVRASSTQQIRVILNMLNSN